MLAAGLPIRNIEENKNVSMYITNRDCRPAGPFTSKLVVTMRPMTPQQAVRAVQITTRFHLTHGAPVHLGDPAEIGIKDLAVLEFGDPVSILAWARYPCSGPAASPRSWRPPGAAASGTTYAPGHMFVSDLRDDELAIL